MSIQSRHLIFLGLFLLIGIVMVSGLRVKTEVSPETRRMFDYIDSLPEGSVLIVSFDHEASSLPEIRPIGEALLRHAFSRGHKLIGVALMAEGTLIGYRMLERIGEEYDREYGRDYVFLGFKPQYIAAILSMAESIEATYPQDYRGQDVKTIPMMAGIHSYDDIAAVLSIADGSFTTHWIEYGRIRHDLTIIAGVTAAMVTTYDPYLASDQLHAMIGGLRGAAEYEKLIGHPGGGGRGMPAQTAAHLYVILMIIIGNVVWWRSRRKGGES
ncbi:MAG TPA: hypothetical protein PLF13_05935 [candidate division Zixibacteria bacterium]|nr:hypothetical protein [candidate division Zixibacteria bacterium]